MAQGRGSRGQASPAVIGERAASRLTDREALSDAWRHRLGLVAEHEREAWRGRAAACVPAWLRVTEGENRGPVVLAVVTAVVLQLLLPRRFSLHPRELLPALEVGLLLALTAGNPVRLRREQPLLRVLSVLLVALITVANAVSAGLLAAHLVSGAAGDDAGPLLLSGGSIYLTNVVAFSLWYWEYDRGGPFSRAAARRQHPDFLFPQMATPEIAPPDWEPRYVDYLYLSFTNATAFSPTDTLPLSRWAKLLMAAQSSVALVTVALVVARAVNVLK